MSPQLFLWLLPKGYVSLSHPLEQFSFGTPTGHCPGLCSIRTYDRPPLSISREASDQALSLKQSWQSSWPSWCPSSFIGSDVPLSLNTNKLFKAAASLQGPLQAPAQGQFSLSTPALPESQDKILIEVMGKSLLVVYCSRKPSPLADQPLNHP